ncbi:cadherin-like protein 26 [Acanthopagrus schlegelii]
MLWFFLLGHYLLSAACSELLSRHRRAWIIDSMKLEEEHPGPFPYELGKINIEREYLIYFDIYGEGVEKEPKGVLSINKNTGIMYVHKPVDFEEKQVLKLTLEARKTDLSIDTKLGIEISIIDINDNPPRFSQDQYEISILENTLQGDAVMTVSANDRDRAGTTNSTVHYALKSFFPKPPHTEFFVDQKFGVISFKGCLDYQVADTFTLLVEAKDLGEVVSLSSSTTIVIHIKDGNNHPPTIRGQTGSGKVKEHKSGISPLRLHVTDKDTLYSTAWRAKYIIQGDEGEHFKIETDPVTNDGILTVVKPLDFEEGTQRQLSISVENEVPYFYCKVKKKTYTGLWDIERDDPDAGHPQSIKVLIEVEDTNDPPEFRVAVHDVALAEDAPPGAWVDTVAAVDPDSRPTKKIQYGVGSDPARWVKVDPLTGNITTVRTLDRESPYVVNGVYTILVYAVEEGNPPLTGTATLNIHVKDLNDNMPQLNLTSVDVCVSDGPTTTSIAAFDLDGEPYGGPFSFKLLGDVKGKWKLKPSHGYTAGLVKEPSVHVGIHTLVLNISSKQGEYAVYDIRVTVCSCSVEPNCTSSRNIRTQAGPVAIIIMLAPLLLVLLLLLLLVKVNCKKEFTPLKINDFPEDKVLHFNTEGPGTDCEPLKSASMVSTIRTQNDLSDWQNGHGMQQGQVLTKMNQNTLTASAYHYTNQAKDSLTSVSFLSRRNSRFTSNATLQALLQRRMLSLWETDNLPDSPPHCYADEGNLDNVSELESISMPDDEDDLFQRALEDLGDKFNQLASICMTPNLQN